MKKRSLALNIVGMALLAGSLVAADVAAATFHGLITTHFNDKPYKVVTKEGSKKDYYPKDYATEAELTKASGDVAEELEAEGMVLLQNDSQGLPLKSTEKKVSLFSVSSVDMVLGGVGSGSVDTDTAPTLKTALEGQGFEVNSTLWDFYKGKNGDGYKRSSPNWRGGKFSINEVPWNDVNTACSTSFASYSDAAIVVLSRSGGEGSDLTAQNFAETKSVEGNKGTYLELSKEEVDMLNGVNAAFQKVIVLINANNPMELGKLAEYNHIHSVLWIGGVGQTGLYAVAKAIKGTVTPSGKLVDTYVYDNDSAPASVNAGANFWIDNAPSTAYKDQADQYIVDAEGIYIGYRYYETRYEDVVLKASNVGNYSYKDTVIYPFGYGLSYTTFEETNFKAEEKDDAFTFSVDVKNTGDTYSGKDVVEVYFQSPYTDYDKANKVEKSSVELCGFAKTELLAPGASTTVTISVPKEELKAYDYTKAKTYILDAGEYLFTIADNAHDATNNFLAHKGKHVADGMTAEGSTEALYSWTNKKFDGDTYSKDTTTGTKITNEFDDASISYYDDYKDFKYLSRSDWTGTYPQAFATSTDGKGDKHITFPTKLIEDLAPKYTDHPEDFKMPTLGAMTSFNLASMIGKKYDDPAWDELLDSMTFDQLQYLVRMGGYGTPIIQAMNKPATVEKDGPAGISATLIGGSKGMAYPTEVVIASTWNKDLAKKMGRSVGNDALYANVQGWYAPAMNTHRTPYSGRNFEYYSEDGFIAGVMGSATVEGASEKGLFTYIKHFAFNNTEGVIDETNGIKGSKDGVSTFFNEQAAREIYLVPFEMSVKEGKATALMNAFNRVGTTWCGASKNLLTNVLREEWGFSGHIITDNAGLPDYMSIRAGLEAGTDIWMNTNETRYSLNDYKNNPQIVTYLRRACHNVLYTTANSAAMNGISADSEIVPFLPTWEKWLIVLNVAVGLGLAGWIVGVVLSYRKGKKAPKKEEETKAA